MDSEEWSTKKVSRGIQSCSTRVQKRGVLYGSSHSWLNAHQLKVAICPRQEDYCDTCSRLKQKSKQSRQPPACYSPVMLCLRKSKRYNMRRQLTIHQALQVTCTTLRHRHVPVKGMKTPSWRKSQLKLSHEEELGTSDLSKQIKFTSSCDLCQLP